MDSVNGEPVGPADPMLSIARDTSGPAHNFDRSH
jgi:hypothetical protein